MTENVLAIGDPHTPVTHEDYLGFCKDVKRKYKCSRVVIMGDMVDQHVVSFHDKHPEAPGVMDEYNAALEEIARWYKAFPNADVLIGNHDERHYRICAKNQIPSIYLKDYNTLFNTPKWRWHTELFIDKVWYVHGHAKASSSSVLPAATLAQKASMSTVLGHFHTKAGVAYYNINDRKQIFGMNVGCGVDNTHPAMQYSSALHKPILSCGVVVGGTKAYVEIMDV